MFDWVGDILGTVGGWISSLFSFLMDIVSSAIDVMFGVFVELLSPIIEAVGTFFLDLLVGIVTHLPIVDLVIPENIFSVLDTFTYSIGYILPLGALVPIGLFWVAFGGLKIAIAIIIRIKSFIPMMGGK